MKKIILSLGIIALSGCTAITISDRQMVAETAKFFSTTNKVEIYDIERNLVTSEFQWKTDQDGITYLCSGSSFNTHSLNSVYCVKQ
ncbi:hypothetical protein NMS10_003131 [Vibrio cholerae]|uniref:hypothetical protein n=1 Tax=Vibrio cholerae TaxID=666 RepID=UPI00115C3B2B|nr:hypothetical protein [Vibrio cholerae]EGR1020306.1 hypothetical protein [Vibrio cholerae]EJL6311328.1 hypothetical protein [Vibrio cholerae]EJL6416592.1 hypothetical protein [Vibrio cholerae]EJL6452476.1 hypothetical protein [Vibrio cholerae]EKF9824753.1 hypothetical protein [Vibrio cholerae]